MTLVVDPPLSVTDIRKMADDIRGHAQDHLAALERLHVETVPVSGRERSDHLHTPNINTITDPPTSNSRPMRCRQLSVRASSPMKRSCGVHLDSCGCAF
jgi:hypothetical protein